MSPPRKPRWRFGWQAPPANKHKRSGSRGGRLMSKLKEGECMSKKLTMVEAADTYNVVMSGIEKLKVRPEFLTRIKATVERMIENGTKKETTA